MLNASNGYKGWSMSVRAAEAYADGEMPKSKWTKKVMLAAIAEYYEEWDYELSDAACKHLEKLTKDELFNRFFYASSWHHTSKFFNATDFYSLDETAIVEYAEHPTARNYVIDYKLGNHSLESAKVYTSKAKAKKHLVDQRFLDSGYCYFFRGNFSAIIKCKEVEI